MASYIAALLLSVVAVPPLDHIHAEARPSAAIHDGHFSRCRHCAGELAATDYNDEHAIDESRPPAPEVILRSYPRCRSTEEEAAWKLSSEVTPRLATVVPYGRLSAEVLAPKQPYEWMELLLDGKTLATCRRPTTGPLVYSIPCPTPGLHVLQARYLRENRWSRFSPGLRFEVRTPPAPRILAAANDGEEPIPRGYGEVVSVSSSSMTVRFGDIAEANHLVLYIDGKRVPVDRACGDCAVSVTVAGRVTAGMHRLTARYQSCCDACTLTSAASNELRFHYYDDAVYVLRPNSRCTNSSPTPSPNPASLGPTRPQGRVGKPDVTPHGTTGSPAHLSEDGQSARRDSNSTVQFVAYHALANPAVEAAQRLDEGVQLRDLSTRVVGDVEKTLAAVMNDAQVTDGWQKSAQSTAESAGGALRDLQIALTVVRELVQRSDKFRGQTRDEGLSGWKNDVEAARRRLESAVDEARPIVEEIERAAAATHSHATEILGLRVAIENHRDAATESLRRAALAYDLARIRANDARLEFNGNANAAAAESARNETDREVGKIEAALREIESHAEEAVKQRAEVTRRRPLAEAEYQAATQHAAHIAKLASEGAADLQKAKESFGEAAAVTANMRTQLFREAVADHMTALDLFARISEQTERVRIQAEAAESAKKQVDETARKVRELVDHLPQTKQRMTELKRDAQRWLHEVQEQRNQIKGLVSETSNVTDSAEQTMTKRANDSLENKHLHTASHAWDRVLSENEAVTSSSTHVARDADHIRHRAAWIGHEAIAVRRQWRIVEAYWQEADALVTEFDKTLSELVDALRHGNDVVANTARTKCRRSVERLQDLSKAIASAKRYVDEGAEESRRIQRDAVAAWERHGERMTRAIQNAEHEVGTIRSAVEEVRRQLDYAASPRKLAEQLEKTWDEAEVRSRNAKLGSRIEVAEKTSVDAQLARGRDRTEALESEAQLAEDLASLRMRAADATLRSERARHIQGPASPIIFATPAHFPLVGYDLRGQAIDRDGLLIHEGMSLSFDRDGNYEVKFQATVPEVATTLRLQLQIQPVAGGPWHTITLSPIQIPTTTGRQTCDDSRCSDNKPCQVTCSKPRSFHCCGQSEILKRCYVELGNAPVVRRTGTARFGAGPNGTAP